jgi:hypothetical protein
MMSLVAVRSDESWCDYTQAPGTSTQLKALLWLNNKTKLKKLVDK